MKSWRFDRAGAGVVLALLAGAAGCAASEESLRTELAALRERVEALERKSTEAAPAVAPIATPAPVPAPAARRERACDPGLLHFGQTEPEPPGPPLREVTLISTGRTARLLDGCVPILTTTPGGCGHGGRGSFGPDEPHTTQLPVGRHRVVLEQEADRKGHKAELCVVTPEIPATGPFSLTLVEGGVIPAGGTRLPCEPIPTARLKLTSAAPGLEAARGCLPSAIGARCIDSLGSPGGDRIEETVPAGPLALKLRHGKMEAPCFAQLEAAAGSTVVLRLEADGTLRSGGKPVRCEVPRSYRLLVTSGLAGEAWLQLSDPRHPGGGRGMKLGADQRATTLTALPVALSLLTCAPEPRACVATLPPPDGDRLELRVDAAGRLLAGSPPAPLRCDELQLP